MRHSARRFACGIALCCEGLGCLSLDPLASYAGGPGLGGSAPFQSGTPRETPDATASDAPPAPGSSETADAGLVVNEGEPNVDSSALDPEDARGDAGAQSGRDAGDAACSGAGEFLGPDASSCYRLVTVGANWSDAALACQSWGGDLVQIDSPAEDDFLAARVSVQIWIGANDLAVEGRFEWSGGGPLGYSHWDAAQPDNYLGIEDCAVKVRPQGTWNDHPCSDLNAYVCERPAS